MKHCLSFRWQNSPFLICVYSKLKDLEISLKRIDSVCSSKPSSTSHLQSAQLLRGYLPEMRDKLLTVMRNFPLSSLDIVKFDTKLGHRKVEFHFPYANLYSGVLISGYSEKSDTFSQLFIVGDIPYVCMCVFVLCLSYACCVLDWKVFWLSVCLWNDYTGVKVHLKSEINWRDIFLPVASAVEVIELALFVCLSGFVRPMLCTTLLVQDSLCTTDLCAPWCTRGTWQYTLAYYVTPWRRVTSQNDIMTCDGPEWRHDVVWHHGMTSCDVTKWRH